MPARAWVTLIVGVFAVAVVGLTVRQRITSDKRTQAWQRITWCLERTLSDNDDEAELGWDVYIPVTDSPLITTTEKQLLLAVANRAARRALAAARNRRTLEVKTSRRTPDDHHRVTKCPGCAAARRYCRRPRFDSPT